MSKIRRILMVIMVAALALSSGLPFGGQPAAANEGEGQDLSPIELPEKGNPKLDSPLNQLVRNKMSGQAASSARQRNITLADERVKVIIESLPGQVDAVTEAATALGASVEASYRNLVQIMVPITSLTALANTPTVRLVRLPYRPVPTVVSQGVGLINADEWQAAGYNGTGVKVAILDLGFQGYTSLLGSELPASVVAQSFSGNITGGGEVHGTASAEIAYDIAPGADFYLVNFATVVELGNAVDWLIAQRVNIISASWGYFTGGPGDGTGIINEMVDKARAAGILWVSAIGNHAQRHWQGDFINTDNDTYHDFAQNPRDEDNSISATNGQLISVELKWDDPWGASANDYDLALFNNTGTLVAWSMNTQNGNDDPVEGLDYTANYTGNYGIAIGKYSATRAVNFHLYSAYHNLQYQVPSSSFLIPADSANATTVGAVYWSTPTTLEPFSSQGPTKDDRVKPDLVAPDGVSTVSYGTSAFYGTSASAPHTAGAAALVKQRYPSYTPAQIQAFLEGQAIDLGSPGKDNLFGSGRLDLGLAYLPPVADFSANVTSGVAPLMVAFTDNSTGNITGWSWNFGDGGNSTAQNPSHQYTIAGTHTVSLSVTGPYGTANKTRNNYITVAPGALHHVVISPSSPAVVITANVTFSAVGQDLYNNNIPGLTFLWSVDNATAGTINATGNTTALFTAGSVPGTYTNTVKATENATGIFATTSVTVTLASMTVTVSLQGNDRTTAQLTVPFMVKLFSPSANLTWQNIVTKMYGESSANFTTSDWGATGGGGANITSTNTTTKQVTLRIAGVIPGIYQLAITSPHNLINLRSGVVVTTVGATVNMSELQEGNGDDSWKIDMTDFGLLAGAFLSSSGGPRWNARADYNNNLQINIADFTIMGMNFNKNSPVEVP